MNFLKILRFDLLSILIFLLVVVISTFKNQKKVWRRGACLLFSIAIVAVVFYFDFGGIYTKFMALCYKGIQGLFNLCQLTLTAAIGTYMLEVVVVACILIIDLLLNLFVKLIGGSDKKKYAKYPNYAVQYRPFVSFLGGLVNGIAVFILFYFVWTSLGNIVALDNSTDLIFNFINNFESVADKIIGVITHVVTGA